MFYNVFFFFCSFLTNAQYDSKNDTYAEVLVTVYIDGYNFESYVLISNLDQIYLNAETLFKTLKINYKPELNTLVGFIESQDNPYTINFEEKLITIGGKSINFSNRTLEGHLLISHLLVWGCR